MKSLRLTEQQLADLQRKRTGQYPPFRNPTPQTKQGESSMVHPLPGTMPAAPPMPPAKQTPDRWPLVLRDQIVEAGLPEPFREFVWHPTRNFRADLAWPSEKLIVECDGAVHRIKGKWMKDIEKHNLMAKHGWVCIRVTPDMVCKGEALQWVKEFLWRTA